MSKEVAVLISLGLVGFLIGGVYSTWKTARVAAIVLLVAAALAAGGAIVWIAS